MGQSPEDFAAITLTSQADLRSCVVVVPLHTLELEASEVSALIHALYQLSDYEFVLLHKHSIAAVELLDRLGESACSRTRAIHCIEVADECLASIDSYNRMLLQAWFYRLFRAWDYLLIFQLDAWILGSNLQVWLQKEFSYIGAPWTGHLGPDTPDSGVGNGGLSLRKVGHMLAIFEDQKRLQSVPVFRWGYLAWRMTLFRRYYLFPVWQWPLLFLKRLVLFARMSHGWHNTLAYFIEIGIQEDHILGIYVPHVFPWFQLPPMPEAAAFAIETNPRLTRDFYAIQRPFGCHAWEKFDRDFWIKTYPNEFSSYMELNS
ncbi:MAG: DUF5672 family protein [Cyanobacteria bacterium]|nr:DUF5672 family protein [Cyanobacteriota bacterium]